MPGPVRSVLLRLEVRPAGRACKCAGNKKHAIVRGEPRFVVQERGIAQGEKGYCISCSEAMLAKASIDLEALREQLTALAA